MKLNVRLGSIEWKFHCYCLA